MIRLIRCYVICRDKDEFGEHLQGIGVLRAVVMATFLKAVSQLTW